MNKWPIPAAAVLAALLYVGALLLAPATVRALCNAPLGGLLAGPLADVLKPSVSNWFPAPPLPSPGLK